MQGYIIVDGGHLFHYWYILCIKKCLHTLVIKKKFEIIFLHAMQ